MFARSEMFFYGCISILDVLCIILDSFNHFFVKQVLLLMNLQLLERENVSVLSVREIFLFISDDDESFQRVVQLHQLQLELCLF